MSSSLLDLENGKAKAKVFKYKTFKVTFDLKMVTDDWNKINGKYQSYWIGNKKFKFLDFEK